MFDPVDPRQHFPSLEEGILKYWKDEDMFRRSITQREGADVFSFYDGPPFATGLPHYGHLVGGTIKDVIPRYQTMKGKQVHRRFGWDCHGLPVEYEIEKEFNLKSKKDIEAMGIATFNEHCRSIVQRYTKEWEKTVMRMGRWVDMNHDYRTMDSDYMESIWWVFRSLYTKGLIYEGHKPMQICPRCVTPLSNFEVTQGYKDITDISAFVKFKVKEKENTFILAWTTTPWTLPGNLFLAIHPDTAYVSVTAAGETYVVAEALADKVFEGMEYEIGKNVPVKDLLAMTYEPLFPYFKEGYEGTAFKVVAGDFVTTEDGTGIVHIAPGFGDDDYKVGRKEKVPMLQHVTMDGHFVPAVTDFPGMEVKPKDDPTKTDQKVIAWLEDKGLLFKRQNYKHSYPHCWRCDSPLLNYATSSWFVSVEQFKDDLLKANKETSWLPAHVRDGRFGKWLEGARDWAISRSRFWGTPLPIWRTDDGKHVEVLGGRDALMERKPMRYTKVSVVRHGESEGNVSCTYQSAVPGTDLTKEGQKQAKEGAAILKNEKVSVIYSSPLARALQTAEAISKATGAEIVVDPLLGERDFGPFDGQTWDDSDRAFRQARRMHFIGIEDTGTPYRFDGMENWSAMQTRISAFMQKTLQRHRSEHIVIVTHGDPALVIRHAFTKEDPFKLCHQPYPKYATPVSYFWDHNREGEADLHKHIIDDVEWPAADAAPEMEVTLVRHGETDFNKNHILQGGNLDAELNETGRKQAHDQAQELKKRSFDVIIASPLKRSKETAEIIAKELGMADIVYMDQLKERDAGTWSGQPVETVVEKHPTGMGKDMTLSFHFGTPEGGESLTAFLKRLQEALELIRTRYAGKNVLLVSHRGTMVGLKSIAENLTYKEAAQMKFHNGAAEEMSLKPFLKRIPDVLDCWFESGSMPYAQQHFPYDAEHLKLAAKDGKKELQPTNFPADFIAEGIDQTRGWFYTLTVLSAALFKTSSFKNVVVNGTVLAEDGRKMSKRLKNYPEPGIVIDKYGADALRFTLMNSPAVRAEDIRFSEKVVEETLRSVLLPLWNSYSFFVTYANLAEFSPTAKPKECTHPLDLWIKAETQDLANRVTKKLDAYDLSGACGEIADTIDALTNWYIRLSRRRFAGKGAFDEQSDESATTEDQAQALETLHQVLVTVSKLLAPFCPYVTEAIYLNLVPEKQGSVHLADWPKTRDLTKEETAVITKNRALRQIVSLGNKVRSEQKMKVRQPLAQASVILPGTVDKKIFKEDDMGLLREEMNVEEIVFSDDSSHAVKIAKVDARKVGPRLGGRVQEIIKMGKEGQFTEEKDGTIVIGGERLSPDEVSIAYLANEGEGIAADYGIVVRMDMHLTEELQKKGLIRDVIRAIQKVRKDNGFKMGEQVTIGLGDELKAVISGSEAMIMQETLVSFGPATGTKQTIVIGDDMSMDLYLP